MYGAALSARCQRADTDVYRTRSGVVGSGKPSRDRAASARSTRCADADVEVFAERPCRSRVSDRYGRRVAAANALVGYRHRGRCAADRGVYAAAPAAVVIVSTWLRVLSKLLSMLTVCPGFSEKLPAVAIVTATSRDSDPPVAHVPELPGVTPLPERRVSVILPPLTPV